MMLLSPVWQPADSASKLQPGLIHVWRWRLDRPSDRAMLVADEQVRADRFRYEHDRQGFVAARCGMRELLGRYLDREPGAIEFTYGAHGKPLLADNALMFNLSHSGEWAMLGIAIDRPIGVDLEQIKPMENVEKLTARFFTPGEHQRLLKTSKSDRTGMFFRTWTCKEAYLKATGEGLGKLKGLEIALGENQAAQFVNPQTWDIQELLPAAGYVGAIAAPDFDWRAVYFELVNSELDNQA
jgi:4'-phosphopantetheinyl transferase